MNTCLALRFTDVTIDPPHWPKPIQLQEAPQPDYQHLLPVQQAFSSITKPDLILISPQTPTLYAVAAALCWPDVTILVQEAQERGSWQWRDVASQTLHPVVAHSEQAAPDKPDPAALMEPEPTPALSPIPPLSVAPAESLAEPQEMATDPTTASEPAPLSKQEIAEIQAILQKIFNYTAWASARNDFRDDLEALKQRLAVWAQREPALWEQMLERETQGQQARALKQEVEKRYRRQGDSPEFVQWFEAATAREPGRVRAEAKREYSRLQAYTENRQRKKATPASQLQPPVWVNQHHPNSLRHLRPHTNWEILIDETGGLFDSYEAAERQPQQAGRWVALAVPGSVKLPQLKPNFHADEASPVEVDQVIGTLLNQPVGVLGLSMLDELIDQRPQWWSGVYRLIRLVMRLLPLDASQPACVSIYIEQKDSYGPRVELAPIRDLLLAELRSLYPARFDRLTLSLSFIAKTGHPYNGYVDALAYTWGSWHQERLHRSQLLGHCFLNPSERMLERLYMQLDRKRSLEPAEWYDLCCQLSQEPESSLVHEAMHQLGEQIQQQPERWQQYLRVVQERLQQKDYQSHQLASVMQWLHHYQPAEIQIPDTLRLQWLTAQLAADNHQGAFDLQRVHEAYQLGQQLQDECAPMACHSHLRIAVAATNNFEFELAQTLLQHWESQPVAVPGLLNYAKVLSSLGQAAAFVGQHETAARYFAQALERFSQLSDQTQACQERQQTQLYQLNNWIEQAMPADALATHLEAYWGKPLTQVIDELAGQTARPYEQHLLLRALVSQPEWDALRTRYLSHRDSWQTEAGHPWGLIMAWRGWLLYCAGDPVAAQAQWSAAVAEMLDAQHGITLHWIGTVWATVARNLTGQPVLLSDGTDQQAVVPQTWYDTLDPKIKTAFEHLQSETDLAAISQQLKVCLPFNFK